MNDLNGFKANNIEFCVLQNTIGYIYLFLYIYIFVTSPAYE